MAANSPIVGMTASLIIVDNTSYAVADSLLKRVREARKVAEKRLNTIIDPIRSGLDSLYALRTELTSPLNKAEEDIKGKMKTFQLEEINRAEKEQQIKEREAEKARQEAAKLEEKAALATRKSVKSVLESKADLALEKALEVEAQIVAPPPRGVSSSVRKVRKATVTNLLELVQAVASGEVPLDILTPDLVMLRSYYKSDPEVVAGWPGVEIVEDVSIVGR